MSTKKLFEGSKPISAIIRSSITSKNDLERLCKKLGIDVTVDWIDNYQSQPRRGVGESRTLFAQSQPRRGVGESRTLFAQPTIKNNILNIDADHIGGTHWVAIFDDKWYFDPLGLPLAREGLDYLNYTSIPIQDYRNGGCGLYCVLFLYYANMGEIDKFYDLF